MTEIQNSLENKTSLAPRLPCSERDDVYRGKAWYLISDEHDVVEKGRVQCSVCVRYSSSDSYMCSKLPATFALFPVLSLWVHPCAIKVFLPPLYP